MVRGPPLPISLAPVHLGSLGGLGRAGECRQSEESTGGSPSEGAVSRGRGILHAPKGNRRRGFSWTAGDATPYIWLNVCLNFPQLRSVGRTNRLRIKRVFPAPLASQPGSMGTVAGAPSSFLASDDLYLISEKCLQTREDISQREAAARGLGAGRAELTTAGRFGRMAQGDTQRQGAVQRYYQRSRRNFWRYKT